MKSDYLAIFEKRAQAYDKAMQIYPHARDAEFQRLLDNVDIQRIKRIVDVPAGGGYLHRYVSPHAQIDSVEPCNEFEPKMPHLINSIDLETLALAPAAYELVVCLAAIHHVQNKQDFFLQCTRALETGGYFCLGDIGYGNPIAQFLDTFAGTYNGTGHHGYYINPEQVRSLAQSSGLTVIDCTEKPCAWEFSNTEAMLHFCNLLFGLQQVSDAQLLEALNHYVGVSELNGKIYLHWKMLYATLKNGN